MQDRMKAMREMHDKMMNAKTPAERQALMADHMKSMQDGMGMMKGMAGMAGMARRSRQGGVERRCQWRKQSRMDRLDRRSARRIRRDHRPHQTARPKHH